MTPTSLTSRPDSRLVSGTQRLINLIPTRRVGLVQALCDVTAWVAAVLVAAFLRLEFSFQGITGRNIAILCVLVVVIQGGVGLFMGLYRHRWRFGSIDEVSALVLTAFATTATLFAIDAFTDPRMIPLSSVLLGGFVGLVGMAAIRYAWRLLFEIGRRPNPNEAKRTIVVGAGAAGSNLVKSLLTTPASPYLPVALIDDDPRKQRHEVSRVRVVGTSADIAAVAERLEAQVLLIAIPSAETAVLARLHDVANDLDLEVKFLPPIGELLGTVPGIGDVRDLTEVDLMGRHEITTDVTAISGYLQGKRVLVTGAGGSIGSELCRQIARFKPDRLLMLDRDESALHALQLSIEGRALLDSPNLILADIRDSAHLHRLFAELRPHVVFHAAALKHLTLLEMHPGEALKSNVWGTQNVLDAAEAAGVERFVNISTDKAANPSSVLGYSKRLAERLTAHKAAIVKSGTYASVRFGNVLGSRGSMLPAFREMIANGGPVTVTHPDVTRFFMTIPEAVQLVIQAGAIGRQGEVMVLDMGEPVKIDDVARRLIKAARKPSVEVVYTGLRPGEKLHEELFGDDEADVRPIHPLISHAAVPALAPADLLTIDSATSPDLLIKELSDACAVRTYRVDLSIPKTQQQL
jgi:FlaA1/EpsC-like NDP-sugar epimerase